MPRKTFFNLQEAKRKKIIDVALKEFATNGYAKTSINSIVTRVDIAKGSIYQYFEDKKDFYLYLVRYVKDLYVTHRAVDVGDISSQPLRTSLKRIILFFRSFLDNYPREVRFYFALVGDTSIPFDDEISKIMTDPSVNYVRDLISIAKINDELREDIDEDMLAFELVVLITSFQQASVEPSVGRFYGIESDDLSSLSGNADALIDLILKGVEKS